MIPAAILERVERALAARARRDRDKTPRQTLTAVQLRDKLNDLVAAGYGDRPVKVQLVNDGITFADPVTDVDYSRPYDGEIVWVYTGKLEAPEWAT